jgi:hypothetical protein
MVDLALLQSVSYIARALGVFIARAKVNGVTVLINLDESSVSGGTMGANHPFSWYHAYDGGCSWYTVGGADSANYLDANFLKHILGGIRYAGAF